jgi:polyisoprenoid-binding protein YceI
MNTTPLDRHAANPPVASRWRLDPDASRVEFRVPHFWGLLTVTGRFTEIDGWLEVDDSGTRRLELTIAAASVATGNRRRDRHLRSADFLAADEYPEWQFRSAAVTDADDGGLRIDGQLAAVGQRIALELATRLEHGDDHLRLEVRTVLDQRRLGMMWSPLGMVRTPVAVRVQAQLRPER